MKVKNVKNHAPRYYTLITVAIRTRTRYTTQYKHIKHIHTNGSNRSHRRWHPTFR